MRMGAFATVGAYGPPNLQHLLLDNGAHESTGGQATVSPHVLFAQVAAPGGDASSVENEELRQNATWLRAPSENGPRVAPLFTAHGTPPQLPRPTHATT